MRAFQRKDTGIPLLFNGARVVFQQVSEATGVILLDETKEAQAALIAELDKLADARKKGVVRISLETREELLKKKPVAAKPRPGLPAQPLRVFSPEKASPPGLGSSSAAPVVPPVVANQPKVIRPSPELAEMLKAKGKPLPAPITVKPADKPEPILPKTVANKMLKSDVPKPLVPDELQSV